MTRPSRKKLLWVLLGVLGALAFLVLRRQDDRDEASGHPETADPSHQGQPENQDHAVARGARVPAVADRGGLPELTVRVSDDSGIPLPEVEVEWLAGDGCRALLGVTRDDGTASFVPPSDPPATIQAQAAGYSRGRAVVSVVPREPIHIILRRLGVIEGTVVRRNRAPAGAGVRVFAWRDFRHPAIERLVAAGKKGSCDWDGAVATSDAQGRFVLEGLSTGCPYTLLAAGEGLASSEQRTGVMPGQESVEPFVDRAYGILVKVRDALGRLPLADGGLYVWSAGQFANADPDSVRFFSMHDVEAALLGLTEAVAALHPRWDHLFLILGNTDKPRVGPIHASVQPAGYHEETAICWAFPLTGEVPSQTVVVVPAVAGWGRLEIHFEGETAKDALGAPIGAAGFTLEDAENGQVLEASCLLSSSPFVLDGVPWGRYRFEASFLGNLHGFPPTGSEPIPVDVGPTPTKVTVPIHDLGAVELRILEPDGGVFEGLVLASVIMRKKVSAAKSFNRAPYYLGALRADTYDIRLDSPIRMEKADVKAEAGKVTVVEFTLPHF